jgi:hypothetical protein
MTDKKKLDRTITTIQDFKKATEILNPNLQLYTEDVDGILTEVTEILMVLSKEEGENPYIILRCR